MVFTRNTYLVCDETTRDCSSLREEPLQTSSAVQNLISKQRAQQRRRHCARHHRHEKYRVRPAMPSRTAAVASVCRREILNAKEERENRKSPKILGITFIVSGCENCPGDHGEVYLWGSYD